MIKLEDYYVEDAVVASSTTGNSEVAATNQTATSEETFITYTDEQIEKAKANIRFLCDQCVEWHFDIAPERDDYRNLGWAIQDIWGADEEGYEIFRKFSSQWSNPKGQTEADIRECWMEYLTSNKYLGRHSSKAIGYKTIFNLLTYHGVKNNNYGTTE